MTPVAVMAVTMQVLELAATGIPRAVAAAETIKGLVAEGRDPTPAEWAELQEVTDALHSRVQAAAGSDA